MEPNEGKKSLPVKFTPEFKRNLRHLAKKYRNIRDDIQPVIDQIAKGTTPGDRITGILQEVYKLRIGNSDARRGKSGGYRLLYQVAVAEVVLITLYSKSEQGDVAAAEIRRIIDAHEATPAAEEEGNQQ